MKKLLAATLGLITLGLNAQNEPSKTQDSTKTFELFEVEVTGEFLRNQAKSLEEQKNNTGVTNVVNMDQKGRTPDANIGDALKRILELLRLGV